MFQDRLRNSNDSYNDIVAGSWSKGISLWGTHIAVPVLYSFVNTWSRYYAIPETFKLNFDNSQMVYYCFFLLLIKILNLDFDVFFLKKKTIFYLY